MLFRTFILLFTLPIVAQADVDFSNYDVPLYTQIVDRIKAKVSLALVRAPNTRERYFIIPFAYQDRGNHPEFSHSFISVIRVFADNKQPKLTPGLKHDNTGIGNSKRLPSAGYLAISSAILICASLTARAAALFQRGINVPCRPAETLRSQKRSSLRWMQRMRWPCGDLMRSKRGV